MGVSVPYIIMDPTNIIYRQDHDLPMNPEAAPQVEEDWGA